jgi:hypothetical protein
MDVNSISNVSSQTHFPNHQHGLGVFRSNNSLAKFTCLLIFNEGGIKKTRAAYGRPR